MIREYININDVNKKLENNGMKVMLDAESSYRGQLFKLANKILKHKPKPKVVLLAGPSCAGKTTTANLLKEIFERKKREVIIISMDDFFISREETPVLPNGMKDFDSLRSVNLKQMERCFKQLFATGEAWFPRYDFVTGLNIENSYHYTYSAKTIIIFEGIHVLNPQLIKYIGVKEVYKIYASTLKGFEFDEVTKMNTRQLRLIRRMIRDVERRGKSPEETILAWQNVCDAEDTYIAPYKNNVDYYINTTHEFEVALYKSELFEILLFNRDILSQLSFLSIFDESASLPKSKLPQTSLMWEFLEKPELEDNDK